MAKIRFKDIIFWLLILAIIGIALWLLSGSPTEANAIISVALFIAASEILIWKNLFNIDKKTAVGFEKIRNDINIMTNDMNNRFNELNSKLEKRK